MNGKNQADQNWCYDAAGNVVDPRQPCQAIPPSFPNKYDGENRLTWTGSNGSGAFYDYDADGRRVGKLSVAPPGGNGSATLYWYGQGGEVLQETDLNGNLQNEYVFFGGKRIARYNATNGYSFYFSDHLGSADVVTDASGNIKEESDFYPFGGERVVTDTGIGNNYKFTGKERDPETGCDYFGARYYCNPIGRFITPDWAAKPTTVPYANFGNPQSLNLYSYVQNNPTTFGDPDGHCPPCRLAYYQLKRKFDNFIGSALTGDPDFDVDHPKPVSPSQAKHMMNAFYGMAGGVAMGETMPDMEASGETSIATEESAATETTVTETTVTESATATQLADDALVVRGGTNTAKNWANGTGVTIDANGNLQGASVNSANGATVEQLSKGIKNTQVGVSTVGEVRAAGGTVEPSPTANNPNHCTLCGITPQKASELHTPTIPNPAKQTP